MNRKIENIIKPELNAITLTLGEDFIYFKQRFFCHHRQGLEANFHKDLTNIAIKSIRGRNSKILIAAPRGSGKSTIITEEFVVYCICNGLEQYILLVGNTIGQVKDMILNVKDELINNRLLAEAYPHACENGEPPKPPRWSDVDIITKNGIRVSALSSMQQFRGKRFKEFRPSLIVLDDIEQDDHTLITPEKTDKLYFWITRTIQNIGTPATNIFLLGTIHSYHSLLGRFIEEDKHPEWDRHIYKAIISESKNPQTWERWKRIYCCQEDYCDKTGPQAADLFYQHNKMAFLEGSETLWPGRLDYYILNVKREEIGEDAFNAEYQNNPSDPAEAGFDIKEVRFIEDNFKSEIELFQTRKKYLKYYGSCDWSSGKQILSGDYSAIIVLARDADANVSYIVCADIARRRTSKTLDDIMAYCSIWPIEKFAIETNQAQDILADLLVERLSNEHLRTRVVRVVSSGNKIERIHNLQPLINTAKLIFSKRHYLLLEELKNFPRGRYKDGLDALEMAVRMVGIPKKVDVEKVTQMLIAINGLSPGQNPNKFAIQNGKFIENKYGLLKFK
jgi:predicted phage terminase large subunit-like protein